MQRCLRPLAVVVLLLTTHAAAFGQTQPLRTGGDRPIDIQHLRLDLKIDLPNKTVDAQATLQVRSLRPLDRIRLDAESFHVKAVRLRTHERAFQSASFRHEGGDLFLDLVPPWPANQSGTLQIDYRIRKPQDGLHFFAPTSEHPDAPLTVWSLGEPISNRHWFPCLDQPNQRQTTEVVATVAEGLEVLSNGRLLEQKANPTEHTVTFHWLQDKPHPSYLVTLVVGPFEVVREEWDHIPILYYVPRGHKAEVAASFGRTRAMLEFFSNRFGVRYPWDKYAQVVAEQFGGGMEHTSATTLGPDTLHDQRALIDHSPDNVIAHELAHQWWGDLVTCRSWAHLWLNEGFATFAEALWAEHAEGADAYAYAIYGEARSALAGGRSRPVLDRRYPNPDAMFDARAYPKGAIIVHMLRCRLGEDAFWRALQSYANTYRLQSVETSDLRKVLERETGYDLERFFYDWTERPGHPVLEVKTQYVPEKKQARVQVTQTQAGEAFCFPLALVLHSAAGDRPFRLEKEITQKEHLFYVPLHGPPTLVEVDPQLAVLAELKEDKSQDLWLAQLRRSASVAARIRAAHHLAQEKTPEGVQALAQALAEEKFWGVQLEVVSALADAGGPVARQALLDGLRHAEPRVRRDCAQRLGLYRGDAEVAAALRALLQRDEPSYFVQAAALKAYAGLKQPDVVAVLAPWMDRASYLDLVRQAAFAGLVDCKDGRVVETLLDWAQKGKPYKYRQRALIALGRLDASSSITPQQKQRIRGVLTAGLDDPSERIRTLARQTLDRLRASQPAAVK
jgi:aminopeptidase N